MDKVSEWARAFLTGKYGDFPLQVTVERPPGPNRVKYDLDTSSGGPQPFGFINSMTVAMGAVCSLRRYGRVERTPKPSTAARWPKYKGDDLGEIVTETTVGAASSGTFGTAVTNGVKFSTKMIKVSRELYTDIPNAEQNLGRILGEQLGRTMQYHFTIGDGTSGAPTGLKNATSAGKTAAATNVITPTELQDLVASVGEAYRENGRWMMNQAILAYLEQCVVGDAGSAPLVQYLPTREGIKPHIFGYPVTPNDYLPDTLEASAKACWFGDFGQFGICEFEPVYVGVNVERYVANNQIAFIAVQRADCGLLVDGAIKHLVMAAS